jgi:hypothetical protein
MEGSAMRRRITRRGALWISIGAASAAGLFLAVVALADPPTLSLTAGNATVGQPIHATAELAQTQNASGEITFEVFGPADPTCSGTGTAVTPAPVAGDGQYVSGDFVPPAAGTYSWSAHYSGDSENSPADATCSAASTVAKASPGLSGEASDVVVGSAIHDEVTVSGGFSPSGEVTFSVYGPTDTGCSNPLESSTVPIAGGHATSADFQPPQAGEFLWAVSYPGDANNETAELACSAANQASTVAKASPSLSGVATSAVVVGSPITDEATLEAGFFPTGEVVFRAYGPGDATCATAPIYEEAGAVSDNGNYAPAGFAPSPGLYRWTVEYLGDANNEAVDLGCNAADQASAVGVIAPTLTVGAAAGTVGQSIVATATIQNGAQPGGQVTFRAFSPGDSNCSGAVAFSSVVGVAGNGSYRSAPFAPSRVGVFRWIVSYSGDANHAPATTACGAATSNVGQAKPTIAGGVKRRAIVGSAFRDTALLQGAYAPGGTVTFRIYGPVAAGCSKPAFLNIVTVSGNGAISSAPFVPQRPGRYSFVAVYSGDAANQGASEPCDSAAQVVQVRKRAPKVAPRARLVGRRQIAIRAHLSGAASPSGTITFRLYGPGDRHCARKPAFSGAIAVDSNGVFPLARYIATKRGEYRLSVGYSGDPRNQRFSGSCSAAKSIRVR